MMKKFTCLVFAMFIGLLAHGAVVDTLLIPSAVMKKDYKAAVVLPASYAKNKIAYPVLYLLHGGFEHFDAWLTKTPDKNLLQSLSDKYNLIIVMPEGELFSFYMDSPHNRESQFETYITKEVVKKIDNTYRTVQSNKGRVISGASMGGFGAIYLSNRHPKLFCASGSMSGAMDLNIAKFKITTEDAKMLKSQLETTLGEEVQYKDFYFENAPVNMLKTIKESKIQMIIDCGVDDLLIDTNREFNRRLLYQNIIHKYIERPGSHTWEYFEESLPIHVQFFHDILRENGVVAQ